MRKIIEGRTSSASNTDESLFEAVERRPVINRVVNTTKSISNKVAGTARSVKVKLMKNKSDESLSDESLSAARLPENPSSIYEEGKMSLKNESL